jgi:cell wall assembly regulator SMI1
MSELTQTLNRVHSQLKNITPKYAQSFQPGLSLEKIKEINNKLKFELPDEIQELFRFIDGTSEDYPFFTEPVFYFWNLEETVDFYLDLEPIVKDLFLFNNRETFPFMIDNGDYYAVYIDKQEDEYAPVILIPRQGGQPKHLYDSLNSMMLIIAECLETGVYFLDEDGYIDVKIEKVSLILRKHNPITIKKTIDELQYLSQRLIKTNECDFETNNKIISDLSILEFYKATEATPMLTEMLEGLSSCSEPSLESIALSFNHTLSVINS